VVVSDSKAGSWLVYTLLRVAIFLVFWLPLQLFTPLRGLLAVVAALLMSGAVSLVLLDRQRGRLGQAAAGFFGGINARIEASARAEDDEHVGDADGSDDAAVPGGDQAPVERTTE
jgi:hypothetical protein